MEAQTHPPGPSILGGILLMGFGALWPELRLTDASRRLALTLSLTATWSGMALNLCGALVNAPGPATEPGRAFDQPWHQTVFFVLIAVVVPTTFGSFFLIWKGLRGR